VGAKKDRDQRALRVSVQKKNCFPLSQQKQRKRGKKKIKGKRRQRGGGGGGSAPLSIWGDDGSYTAGKKTDTDRAAAIIKKKSKVAKGQGVRSR